MKQMADKQSEPLRGKLKTDLNKVALLIQMGDVYKAYHQFTSADEFYEKSSAVDPKNVGARTDMASCLYYLGDAEAHWLR